MGVKAKYDWRRILVPVVDNAESERALDVACRLAADRHASLTVVAVLEVPQLLPLDSHMDEEKEIVREVLGRAETIADSYGIDAGTRVLRAREASVAIVDEAKARKIELLVIGAPHRRRASARAPVFGATVLHVLRNAPCRVMIISAPEAPAVNGRVTPAAAQPSALRS